MTIVPVSDGEKTAENNTTTHFGARHLRREHKSVDCLGVSVSRTVQLVLFPKQRLHVI